MCFVSMGFYENNIHSFFQNIVLPYEMPIASSKASLHIVWFTAPRFNFQYPFVSVRLSSSCLHLLHRLPSLLLFPLPFFSKVI